MPEMKAALGTQADMTVFRKLALLDHLTSYSHRGSYYTLRSIPRFDEQGIWLGRGAWFSRHGTLLDTIPVLVKEAVAGYLAAELETVLHVPVKDALRQLTLAGRVYREEFQGLYRVLAADVRKWDTDGGSGLRLDIFPLSQPVYPQADRADGSARVVG
jgi:hypothetical protein